MLLTRLAASILILSLGLAGCDKATVEEAGDEQPLSESTHHAHPTAAALERTPSPDGARVFFITPTDGAVVSNPVVIDFGIEGMSVTKAGDQRPDSGHHHLLIDAELPDLSLPIPASENYVHFGDGSTSAKITLEPGPHTLRMLLGDHLHIPHDPPVISESITITVE